MKPSQVHVFQTAPEAGRYLAKHLPEGATVLGKGSQDKIFVEDALAPLLSRKRRTQLVRQTKFWVRKKQAYYDSLQPPRT